MSVSENQIVYQPNETVRLDVRLGAKYEAILAEMNIELVA